MCVWGARPQGLRRELTARGWHASCASPFRVPPPRLVGKCLPRSQEGLAVCFPELSGAGPWGGCWLAWQVGNRGRSWWTVWVGGSSQIPCFQRRVSKPRSALLPFGEGEGRWMRGTVASPACSSPRPPGPRWGRLPEKGPWPSCPQSCLHSMAWHSRALHAEPLLRPGLPAAPRTLAALQTCGCDVTVPCPSGLRAVLPGEPTGPMSCPQCSQGSHVHHTCGPPSRG